MHVALVTCSKLPDWEVDDRPLHGALRARGATVLQPAWDDQRFDWAACDAVLIRTTWDYQERHREFVSWAKRTAGLCPLFNPLPVVLWNTEKTYLRDLNNRGVRTIPTVWLEAGARVDLHAVLSSRDWAGAFLKPAIGATARETLRFRVDTEGLAAAEVHLNRLLPHETMLLQPYLSSVECEGELSLIFIDGVFSHAVRKVPVSGDYRVQDDFGAHDEPSDVSAAEIDHVRRILDVVPHDLLYARADFLRDDSGDLCLSELELVEPSLFFRHCPAAADRLADALLRRIKPD